MKASESFCRELLIMRPPPTSTGLLLPNKVCARAEQFQDDCYYWVVLVSTWLKKNKNL